MLPHRPDAEQSSTAHAEIQSLLMLKHPTRPACKLPLPLRKLAPHPLTSQEDWHRFVGDDLEYMTPAARDAEAFRIRTAIAAVDVDEVPEWFVLRIHRLEASA